MKMARIEVNGEENGVGEDRPESFENEQRIIGIRAQNPDCFRPFSFVLNPRGQGAHIIKLTGTFRTLLKSTGQNILSCYIGFGILAITGSYTITARHFSVEAAEIAIPEDV